MWADAPAEPINRSSSNKLNTLHTLYLITLYQLQRLCMSSLITSQLPQLTGLMNE